MTSAIDHQRRLVLAPEPTQPSKSHPALPPAHELASQYGYPGELARRACPVCFHPLPRSIDGADIPTVVLLGEVASGKTAFIAALRAQPYGVFHNLEHKLLVTEDAREILDAMKGEDQKTLHDLYMAGSELIRTQTARKPPLTFTAQPGGENSRGFDLQITDPAGEDIVSAVARARVVPVLRWASALVLMVPKRGEVDQDGRRLDRAGAVLGGVTEQYSGKSEDLWPTLIICASKIDEEDSNYFSFEALNEAPVADRTYSPDLVRGVVLERDSHVVEHAARWPEGKVLWRAVAAMPHEEDRSPGKPVPAWGMGVLVDDIVVTAATKVHSDVTAAADDG